MSNLTAPSIIIYLEPNFADTVLAIIKKQFFIEDTWVYDAEEFDNLIAYNSGYIDYIHGSNTRVLVLRKLSDTTNRELADLVLFYKNNLITVEVNKNGPHGLTLPLDRATLAELMGLH